MEHWSWRNIMVFGNTVTVRRMTQGNLKGLDWMGSSDRFDVFLMEHDTGYGWLHASMGTDCSGRNEWMTQLPTYMT